MCGIPPSFQTFFGMIYISQETQRISIWDEWGNKAIEPLMVNFDILAHLSGVMEWPKADCEQ
jgi:hypothetical protein